MAEIVIGIDLGTTNSLVAHCDERGPRVIAGPDGQRILPSVVHIDPTTGRTTVGKAAADHGIERATQTVFSVKRLMGRGMADVAADAAGLSYRVVEPQGPADDQRMVEVDIAGLRITPQQVSALILAELKRWAEAHFGRTVTKAVVTVPAYFDDAQRQATRDAGRIAGLEVLRIVNEPTAAALAYGLDQGGDATIAVYDFGGGTFDVSILRIEKGVFRVLATHGDTHLGGDDIDRLLMRLVEGEMGAQFGDAVELTPSLRQAIRTSAERARIELSDRTSAAIEIELGSGRKYLRSIEREELAKLAEPLIERTLECCRIALRNAGAEAGRIDRVVMVGGLSYMPLVRKRVGLLFGREPYTALNPMEVVALGAAVQAGIIAGVRRDALLLDITPLSLGIETVGGAVSKLIPQGTTIPCQAQDVFSTFVDGQTSVKIHVLQGEREMVKDCRSLGQFILRDIPPMAAGIPKLLVTFLVDASGILSVSAIEMRSGREASIQVVPTCGLTRGEVDDMVRQGFEFAGADLFERRVVELRNQIAIDTAAIEKSLARLGNRVQAGYRKELARLVEGLRGMAAWRDPEAMSNAMMYVQQRAAALAEMALTDALKQATDQTRSGATRSS